MSCNKRWFKHFYFTATMMAVACSILFWSVSETNRSLPKPIEDIFIFLTTQKRYAAVSSQLSWIALGLYSGHVFKRLYECLCLSIFSDSQMSVFHYIVGHTHYIGAFIGLLSLFPGISTTNEQNSIFDNQLGVFLLEIFSVAVILMAALSQFHSLQILANLRKISTGKKHKNDYLMPVGGMFNFVSCPHMFSEIMVYLGLASLMRFQHTTWNVICLFVCCNQIQVALLNHRWYREHFRDYPLQRKAIIPFIL